MVGFHAMLGSLGFVHACGRARSGCEMTRGNFEVEVLGIYGRRELCTHGSGARLVSDGPCQPVDAADVRRRVVFGARQDNEFAVRHCCVLWAALVDVGGARDASKAPANRLATSRASKREVDGPTTNRIFYSRSFEKDLQLEWRSSRSPRTERKGFQWRVVTSTW